MRLTEVERQSILRAVGTRDRSAPVYLFGSRADDAAKGGDIDLLVLSSRIDFMGKLDILGKLHRDLGEQKIDLVIYPDLSKPFAQVAMEKAVRL